MLYDPLPHLTFPASASSANGASKVAEVDEDKSSRKRIILWIGGESTTLTKLLLTAASDEVGQICLAFKLCSYLFLRSFLMTLPRAWWSRKLN